MTAKRGIARGSPPRKAAASTRGPSGVGVPGSGVTGATGTSSRDAWRKASNQSIAGQKRSFADSTFRKCSPRKLSDFTSLKFQPTRATRNHSSALKSKARGRESRKALSRRSMAGRGWEQPSQSRVISKEKVSLSGRTLPSP